MLLLIWFPAGYQNNLGDMIRVAKGYTLNKPLPPQTHAHTQTHRHTQRQTNLKNTHGKAHFNHLLPCCCGDYGKMSLWYRVLCSCLAMKMNFQKSLQQKKKKKTMKQKHSRITVNKKTPSKLWSRFPERVTLWTFITCDGIVKEAKPRLSPPPLLRNCGD